MFGSILVPLDGSRFAEAALPIASRLARSAHGVIQLLMIRPGAARGALVSAGAQESEGWGGVAAPDRARQLEYLADTVERLASPRSPGCTYELWDGPPAETLCRAVDELHPDLVVMTTHGAGSLSPFWLGSVADYLLRRVAVPVLLVRPQPDEVGSPGPPIRRIVVPVDLSTASREILPVVKQLACLEQAHVTLLTVVEPAPLSPPVPGVAWRMGANLETDLGRAQKELDQVAAQLRMVGIRSAARVEVDVDVAGAVLRYLADAADLAAFTTHGASGGKKFLVGPVADKLIRGARKPLLVLRPAAA